MIVKAGSLSTHDFVLPQEQVTALSNSRQSEDKKEVQVVAEHEPDISASEVEPSASLEWRFSTRRLRKRRQLFELWLLCRSQVSGRQSSSSFPCCFSSRAIWHALFFRPPGFSRHSATHCRAVERLSRVSAQRSFWNLLVGKQCPFWSALDAGSRHG